MPHLFNGSSFDTVFSISACVSTFWLLFYLAVCSCSLFFAPLSVWCSQRGFCGTPRGGWALNQQKRSCCTKAEKNKIAIKYLTKSHIAGSLLIIFFSLFRFNISELSFHLLVKSNINEVISSWLVRERSPVFGIWESLLICFAGFQGKNHEEHRKVILIWWENGFGKVQSAIKSF